jgi:hypothetical protein
MWQPSPRQWAIIWPVALLVVLAWPPDAGRSLGMKIAGWVVDPRGQLPAMPPPLPMGLDDDGNAVAEHDMLENAYLQARERSSILRFRMDVKDGADPFDPSTQRQLLVGLAVLGALVVWRLDSGRPVAP